MYKNLKEGSCYIDLYDFGTIENCLESIERWQKLRRENFNDEGIKNLSEEERVKGFAQCSSLELYTIKGQRYKRRSETINEWISRDRKLDEKYESAQEPKNIRCAHCAERMSVTLKDLYNFPDEPLRVLFFFECPRCKKRKGVFDDGKQYVHKPEKCPKCHKDIENSFKREGKIDTWAKNCPSCGFTDTETEDMEKKEAEREVARLREEELLKKYRAEFCLSESDGQEYIESLGRIESLLESFEREEEKRSDPDYEKVTKLKKLTIVEIEKTLFESLEKQKYIKLMLDKPNMGRFIMVPFTVQDADSSRKEYDSIRGLKKLIKATLEGTNWRLMSEGVDYKLGYLTGRLKGCDQEEDLIQIIKNEKF